MKGFLTFWELLTEGINEMGFGNGTINEMGIGNGRINEMGNAERGFTAVVTNLFRPGASLGNPKKAWAAIMF